MIMSRRRLPAPRLFTSEGKEEIDRWIGEASVVMLLVYCTFVVKSSVERRSSRFTGQYMLLLSMVMNFG